MGRAKEWWGRLTKDERSELVYLERASNQTGSGSAYLPDDCSECMGCGNPTPGSGLCTGCLDRLIGLIEKADGGLK